MRWTSVGIVYLVTSSFVYSCNGDLRERYCTKICHLSFQVKGQNTKYTHHSGPAEYLPETEYLVKKADVSSKEA